MSGARTTRLDHLAAIDVRGDDAATFLHAQLCGDVLGLPPARCRFTAWCDPKGRVIASFLLARGPSGFRIVVRRDLAGAMLKKLRLYVLRSRVEFIDAGLAVAGWYGAPAGATAPVPGIARAWDHAESGDLAASALPGTDGFRLLLSGAPPAVTALTSDAGDAASWALEDIRTGLAWIGKALGGEFLPQEIDLERFEGLSYTKGCFPGQEIIARVHSRGRLKRGLHAFTVDNEPPGPGTRIVDADGTAAGLVIAAERAGGASRGLAVSDLERSARNLLHLDRSDGPALRFDARRPD